jgi:HEAT repeat protein
MVADLLAALRDSHADVRTAAAWALGSIGNAKASPGLTAALQDANAEVRRKAAEALARLRR